MNRNLLLGIVVAVLVAVIALTFRHPAAMVSPGPLQPAHAGLATDCFACHVPWRGVRATQCTNCHAVADIGRKTSRGVPIVPPAPGFHQKLAQTNCLDCHTDHQGVRPPQRFSHALLAPDVRRQCASCHVAPATAIHRNAGPACSDCHGTTAWKPATFDHARFFGLTGAHATACATCHIKQDYRRYTCYGCHAHTPANVRAEHDEMRATTLDNCVQCHRTASGRGEGGERGGGGDDD